MEVSIKSYAKVNIFLKISGKRDNYHNIVSRFIRVKNLYDIITFTPNNITNEFNLIGNFGCKTQDNSIYKAFLELRKYCPKIDAFFRTYNIKVQKNIPEFAGLGGGSSNAAAFLVLANKYFNLHYKKDKLAKIGARVGADVPFFIYEYDSANVTGVGEIVEEFKEKSLNIEVFTPREIKSHTDRIFKSFRNEFYKEITPEEAKKLLSLKSIDILKKFSIEEANDLYLPALKEYPSLKKYSKEGWFFSGSGSSFFKVL